MAGKKNTSPESTEDKESLAKKIWLAGLGAYGQGFDEALEQYNKVNEKTTELFSDLVKKGNRLEEKTRSKLKEVKTHSTETIDQRIGSVRDKLGLNESSEETQLERLEAKLDALIEVVQTLCEAKAPTKGAKAEK
jgi:homoserine dehydrogenase